MVDRLAQYANTHYVNDLNTNTSMLDEADKEMIKYAINKEWTNPKFKMRYFVGQTQITPFAKLRQWLLELRTREESIEHTEYEIRKWEVNINRHKHLAENHEDPFERELNAIEAEKLVRQQLATRRRLQDWYLERQQFIDLINEFKESEEALLPDGSGRTYFDIINTDEEDLYEAEYWTNRLAKQASSDLLFYGRVNTGNMDAILSMGEQQQAETLALAHSYATQIKQIETSIQLEVENKLGIEAQDILSLTTPDLNAIGVEMPKSSAVESPVPVNGEEADDGYNLYNS
jgi:hypothetical protein